MKMTNDEAVKISGTSFMGYVKSDYTTLVTIFGDPTVKRW